MATTPRRARQILALIGLALLLAGSRIVAWRVSVPDDIPAVAWNSPRVLRGEVFLGFFVRAYVVLAICATTIVSGRPPRKLRCGLLAFEQAELETAVDAPSEGRRSKRSTERCEASTGRRWSRRTVTWRRCATL